ncbi:hypothetical protein [Limisphaera sp. 4302-co]|uniref:hypothetical protein n=1 Tax=Limisphaera sp. 4302-co TaxID=3400417 RepID=UPI003C230C37
MTLHAQATSFLDWFLDDEIVEETEDAEFWPYVVAPEPLQYQWYALYPWTNDWMLLPGQTNATLVLTNVDSWDHCNWFGVLVRSAAGETMWVGPAMLWVVPQPIIIPSSGRASRYPATIEVFGMPTNVLWVEVTLAGLSHNRPEDLDILLVSPSGAKIMLMSDAGGSFAVTNATLVFHPYWMGYPTPPENSPIPSNFESHYRAANHGEQETQLPGAPAGPYSTDLDILRLTDPAPNGVWKLYIYDDKSGQTGVVQDSWSLRFYY